MTNPRNHGLENPSFWSESVDIAHYFFLKTHWSGNSHHQGAGPPIPTSVKLQ